MIWSSASVMRSFASKMSLPSVPSSMEESKDLLTNSTFGMSLPKSFKPFTMLVNQVKTSDID